MNVSLTVVAGAKPHRFERLKLPTTLGRGDDTQIKIRESVVSRHHCFLACENGELVVHDLGSLNGTLVNDRAIEAPTCLHSGDTLTIGHVVLRVNVGERDADSGAEVVNESSLLPPEKKASAIVYEERDHGSFIGITPS